eukprot:3148045-Karenia_brevis.AAC.1
MVGEAGAGGGSPGTRGGLVGDSGGWECRGSETKTREVSGGGARHTETEVPRSSCQSGRYGTKSCYLVISPTNKHMPCRADRFRSLCPAGLK